MRHLLYEDACCPFLLLWTGFMRAVIHDLTTSRCSDPQYSGVAACNGQFTAGPAAIV
jgi:hypothetical protein